MWNAFRFVLACSLDRDVCGTARDDRKVGTLVLDGNIERLLVLDAPRADRSVILVLDLESERVSFRLDVLVFVFATFDAGRGRRPMSGGGR